MCIGEGSCRLWITINSTVNLWLEPCSDQLAFHPSRDGELSPETCLMKAQNADFSTIWLVYVICW